MMTGKGVTQEELKVYRYDPNVDPPRLLAMTHMGTDAPEVAQERTGRESRLFSSPGFSNAKHLR